MTDKNEPSGLVGLPTYVGIPEGFFDIQKRAPHPDAERLGVEVMAAMEMGESKEVASIGRDEEDPNRICTRYTISVEMDVMCPVDLDLNKISECIHDSITNAAENFAVEMAKQQSTNTKKE